ncbi:NAD(P)-dependent oxidoreductase [Streptomyces marincola]|uniref:NAD(P)-dependent oxidoreductase n=1 Tax=Streptomyces marincola TaxID=2878388 RepID=UPI00131C31DC|nr:NAD(P)-binding domain-containing protein [Streptomyces marincola]
MSAPPVAVLGTGRMGGAMARALIGAGHPTTVWNRTPERTRPLVAAGAVTADTPAAAAAAAPLVILCVTDDDAARAVLTDAAAALQGRTLVNVTTSTPEQARAAAALATSYGADYLAAPAMADYRTIGRPETHIMYSGQREAYDRHEDTLHALGKAARYVGADPGIASLFELAMLSLFFEVWTGYLHVLALIRHEGVPAGDFAPVAARTFGEISHLLPLIAQQVDSGDHDPAAYGGVAEQAAFTDTVIELRRTRGIDTTRLEHLKALMERAITEGKGEQGMSALFETLLAAPPGT